MFDISNENMSQEIATAEKATEDHLSGLDPMILRFVGRVGAIDAQAPIENPENHTFEYLSLMVPKIAYDNPRVSVRSRRQTSEIVEKQFRAMLDQAVAVGMIDPMDAQEELDKVRSVNGHPLAVEHGLNRWVRDSEYHVALDRVAYDFLLAYGCLHSSLGVAPGQDPNDPESLRWPESERLSPMRCIQDPVCLHPDEAEWNAHWETIRKKSLIERAEFDNAWRLPDEGWGKWNLDAIEAMSPIGSTRRAGRMTGAATDIDRGEVQLYHAWVRDYREDDWPGPAEGYHGALLTIGTVKGSDGDTSDTHHQMLRTPQPYFGPAWGPRVLFGAYVEPDNGLPLSPLQATKSQANELNAHAVSMGRNAAQYKRIIMVSDRNPRLKKAVKDNPDNFVISVEDELFDKDQVVQLEIAGVSEQQIKHYEMFRERLARISGLTDAQRGDVKTGVTATADAIADSASDVRTGYLQKRYAESVRRDLKTKVFYFVEEENIEFALGPDAGEAMGMMDPYFVGGPEEELDREDLELEIDAFSMGRTNEALLQKRTLEIVELILSMAPLMATMPWIEWKEVLRRVGDAMNMPDLGDVVNVELASAVGSNMMAAGGPQPGAMSGDGAQRAGIATNQDQPAGQAGAMRGAEAGGARQVA